MSSGPIHYPLTTQRPMSAGVGQPVAAFPNQPQHAHAHAAAAAAAAAHQYAQQFAYYPQPPPAASPVAYPSSALPPPPQHVPSSYDPMTMSNRNAMFGGNVAAAAQPYPAASAVPSPLPYGATLDPHFDAEAELLFLNKLEKKAFVLQQKGHHLYAIELMEQSVASRKLLYGPLSEEVMAAAEKLALLYNSLAMSSLYKEEYKQALRLLRKAELLTSHISQLTSVRVQTLNNLACAYRRLQRPKTALNLLRESLVLLSAEQTVDGRPVTHLNMCAILSQLHRHTEALDHAKAAVMYCQKQLLQADESATVKQDQERRREERRERRQRRYENGEDMDSASDEDDSESDLDSSIGASSSKSSTAAAHLQLTEKIVILGISYHNLAVEEEFLGNWSTCVDWYTKAYHLASRHLGPDEEITQTFRSSWNDARGQMDQRRKEDQRRARERVESIPKSGSQSRSSSRPASASRAGASSSASSRPSSASSHGARRREAAVGAAATAAQRARPSSAAPYREASSSAYDHRPAPAYTQDTAQSSGRIRPKSASVSRPPRPR